MLKKLIGRGLFFTLLFAIPIAHAGKGDLGNGEGVFCGTDYAMQDLYSRDAGAAQAAADFNESLAQQQGLGPEHLFATPDYRIPVVFHVYGSTFNGKEVTYEIIEDALRMANEDFQGLTADWNEIVPEFDGIKKEMSIEFMLAKRDPNGKKTTGVVWHPNAWGYGNWYHNSVVAQDAWDNSQYMNIYIQNDLYGDSYWWNSGVAWYPDTGMTEANTARVVYNGAYLGDNTSVNFRSVLTHEFGHWLNLAHTFEGGCSADNEALCATTGDYVCDTPQVDHSGLDSAGELNCLGQETNWQNFMAYSSQYAMYTRDQVTRMIAALDLPSRYSLWQADNLDNTGVFEPVKPAVTISSSIEEDKLTNDGSLIGKAKIRLTEDATFKKGPGEEWKKGRDYILWGLPKGLSASITTVDESYAELTVSGTISCNKCRFHHHRHHSNFWNNLLNWLLDNYYGGGHDDDDDDSEECNNHSADDSFDIKLFLLNKSVNGGARQLMNRYNKIHVPLDDIPNLNDGIITGIAASDKENKWFSLDIPEGTTRLTLRAEADNGDADMMANFQAIPYDNYLADYLECRSVNWYSDEECVYDNPPVGKWYIVVHAWEGYENLTLSASLESGPGSNGTELTDGIPLTISQPVSKKQDHFYIDVPEGATEVSFTLLGGNGDADIYTRYDGGATTQVYDCVSWNWGSYNDENCTHTDPLPGRWHVMVFSWEAYENADLTATITTARP